MRFFTLSFFVFYLLIARCWFLSQFPFLIPEGVVVIRNHGHFIFLLSAWYYRILLISCCLLLTYTHFSLSTSLCRPEGHGAVGMDSPSYPWVSIFLWVFASGESSRDWDFSGGLASALRAIWMKECLLTKERVCEDLSPNLTSLFIFLKN